MRAGISLRSKLTVATSALLCLSLFLALALIAIHSSQYRAASRRLSTLRAYQSVLVAANAISKERGPTNTLLGGDYAPEHLAWARLREARAQSDAALACLMEYHWQGSKAISLTSTRIALQTARERVDAALTFPLKERTLDQLRAAITGMFEAVDAIKPLINQAALAPEPDRAELADEAGVGLQLFEIRDDAGRLGSVLTPYIALQTMESGDDQYRLARIYGRIQQLWELTRPYLENYPELAPRVDEVEKTFFIDGIALITQLNAEAKTGRFSMSTRIMTEKLVPTFEPLERARDAYLDSMMDQAQTDLSTARHWLITIALLAAGIIAIDVMLALGMRWLIFNPLLQARQQIVSLADESITMSRALDETGPSEVDDVFHAIDILRSKLTERTSLLEQLRLQASTDGLTGLLNRRTLEEIGSATPMFEQIPMDVGIILVDIDHFKHINDTYGHGTGDRVLKTLALILRQRARSTDLVLRFGGEEFAIVLPSAPLQALLGIAEELRVAIAEHPIDDGNGGQFAVTASFGVALGRRGNPAWAHLVEDADKALYEAKESGRNRVCTTALF